MHEAVEVDEELLLEELLELLELLDEELLLLLEELEELDVDPPEPPPPQAARNAAAPPEVSQPSIWRRCRRASMLFRSFCSSGRWRSCSSASELRGSVNWHTVGSLRQRGEPFATVSMLRQVLGRHLPTCVSG